jgi:hypothetical protein
MHARAHTLARIHAHAHTSGPGNDDSWKGLEEVFVILFQIPGGGEGIYSLQVC